MMKQLTVLIILIVLKIRRRIKEKGGQSLEADISEEEKELLLYCDIPSDVSDVSDVSDIEVIVNNVIINMEKMDL